MHMDFFETTLISSVISALKSSGSFLNFALYTDSIKGILLQKFQTDRLHSSSDGLKTEVRSPDTVRRHSLILEVLNRFSLFYDSEISPKIASVEV